MFALKCALRCLALVVLGVSVVYWSHAKIGQKCVVCCVCNVSCLCPTSSTCNSMSRRRKEKDSFMRFVIVSIVSFTWLFSPLNLKNIALPIYSHLLVWIRQTVKYPCFLLLPQFFLLQIDMSIQGIED